MDKCVQEKASGRKRDGTEQIYLSTAETTSWVTHTSEQSSMYNLAGSEDPAASMSMVLLGSCDHGDQAIQYSSKAGSRNMGDEMIE